MRNFEQQITELSIQQKRLGTVVTKQTTLLTDTINGHNASKAANENIITVLNFLESKTAGLENSINKLKHTTSTMNKNTPISEKSTSRSAKHSEPIKRNPNAEGNTAPVPPSSFQPLTATGQPFHILTHPIPAHPSLTQQPPLDAMDFEEATK